MFCFSIMTTSFINFVVSFQTLLRKLAISGNNSVTSYLPLVELLEGPAGASLSALPTVLMLKKKRYRSSNRVVSNVNSTYGQLSIWKKWCGPRSQVTEQTFNIYGGRWNIHVQIYEVSEEIP